jgi:3-dehydroquinate synthetase
MIAANAVAVNRGMLDRQIAERIDGAILALEPARIGDVDPEDVYAAIRHDKKFSSSEMVMALATAVGDCRVVTGIGEEEVRSGINAVLRRSSER